MESKGFEFLEHTADLLFRSYGETPDECFTNAAKAMFSSMTDLSRVRAAEEKEIDITAPSLETLLHDYLSEALLYFEIEGLLFSEFSVSIKKNESYRLTGKFRGERYDPKMHTLLVHIKAVTFHELSVKEEDGRWTAVVLCDI